MCFRSVSAVIFQVSRFLSTQMDEILFLAGGDQKMIHPLDLEYALQYMIGADLMRPDGGSALMHDLPDQMEENAALERRPA